MIFSAILLFGILLKVPFCLFWDLSFTSDTAVLGLMAEEFAKGRFALYYWGEGYYGNLDSVLLMPLFKFFGATPQVSQIIPLVFAGPLLWAYHACLKKIYDAWTANVSSALLAASAPFFTGFGFGVYNYAILPVLGLLQMILFTDLLKGEGDVRKFFMFGLLAGFSWFYFRLIAVFWIAMLAHAVLAASDPARSLFRVQRPFFRKMLLLEDAALPRALKALLVAVNFYNIANASLAVLLWFSGDLVLNVSGLRAKFYFWPIAKSSVLMAAGVLAAVRWKEIFWLLKNLWERTWVRALALGFVLGYSPAIVGMFVGEPPRSPGGIVPLPNVLQNLALCARELIPLFAGTSGYLPLEYASRLVAAASVVFILWRFRRILRERKETLALPAPDTAFIALGVFSLVIGLAAQRMADRNALRYLLPLFLVIPVGISWILGALKNRNRILSYAVFAAVLLNGVLANVSFWKSHRNPHPYMSLIRRISEKGITAGYASYDYAYELTFLSGGKLTVVPTGSDDRYPPYREAVRAEKRAVLIGEDIPGNTPEMQIKGLNYRITGRESMEELPVIFLEKIS